MLFEDNFDSKLEQNERSLSFEAFSLYDTNSRDSGFEEICLESFEDDAIFEEFSEIVSTDNQLPTSFVNLIHKPIAGNLTSVSEKSTSSKKTASPFKRTILQNTDVVEKESQSFLIKRQKLIKTSRAEKRRNKLCSINTSDFSDIKKYAIKTAIQKSYSEPDLIADFSRKYLLPLAASRHQDLKAIDANTLKNLLNGEFKNRVDSFKIIDCRYPYEFEGGHITGALNLYTREQCISLLEQGTTEKASVLIFHCEFSSERGPNLYRYLRQEDRRQNAHTYPSLCFPEMYILEGGYQKFFENYSKLCSPETYTQMLDPKYSQQFSVYRQVSKTWNCDAKFISKR